MHDFHFKNKELTCESVRIADIARKVGTPVYVYSYKTLTDHFTKIKTAFAPVSPTICFAMKSNDNLAVVKALLNEGAGVDIVSAGELRKALKLGANPKKIVFASVGKTEDEIRLALKTGILLFNVESTPELEEINHVAKKLKMKARVALRINPDVSAATHEAITTGTLKKKFGIDLLSAHRIFRAKIKYPHIQFCGIHVHIGSQITTGKPFIKALKKVIEFIGHLRQDGIHLEYLDIGGGLGIIYKDEQPQTAQQFADAVLPLLRQTGLKIIMEPGRFIVGNAGIFVTRVLYLKDNGYKKFVIVDGGMNDLIRPALYHAYHEIVPVKTKAAPKIKADIVGPVCESGDFFAKDREIAQVGKNDLLAIMSAGAYGFSMSSNYNSRCKPAEVMVKGNKFYIVKERETFVDLIRGEKIPEFLK